jgi:multiple sugar transport system ATP-binding protein
MQLDVRIGNATLSVARIDPQAGFATGDTIRLAVTPEQLHFFDPVTETAIR